MPALVRAAPGSRRHLPSRRSAALAGLLIPALACRDVAAPAGASPDLKGGSATTFAVSPSALQFVVPPSQPATITVTTQFAGTIAAASSDLACATASPPSAPAIRSSGGMMVYVAMFTVTPVGVGTCAITVTDKKGRQLQVPVTVAPSQVDLRAETIVGGAGFGCGLTSDGKAYCWGLNTYGQLGDGTTISRIVPVAVLGPGGGPALTFASLAAGSDFACGLTGGGDAYCWGNNLIGEFGNGSVGAPVATPVPAGGGLTFTRLTAGIAHTCGLTGDGTAYCWGRGSEGQLGNGQFDAKVTPTPVMGGQLLFASLTAGDLFTCGLVGNGAAYCWGINDDRQLGDGGDLPQPTPVAVLGPGAGSPLAFTGLAAGGSHACGRTATGAVYCWGDNADGQLGDGSNTDRSTPTLVGGGVDLASVAADGSHSCGLTGAGLAYCWGSNFSGELGIGSTTSQNVPTMAVGPGGGAALAFATIGLGAAHSCGITSGGTGYCWGLNIYGQLGDGTGGGALGEDEFPGGPGIPYQTSPSPIAGPDGGPALIFKVP